MFDLFSDEARRAMGIARQEALRLRHAWIGPEHLALGILKDPRSRGSELLQAGSVDLKALRVALEGVGERGDGGRLGQLPFTPGAKGVLEVAAERFRALGHEALGTEHLLLGLLADLDAPVGRVLVEAGADPAGLYRAVAGEDARAEAPAYSAGLVEALARAEMRAGRGEVTSDLVLLELLEDPTSATALALRQLGVDVERLRRASTEPLPAVASGGSVLVEGAFEALERLDESARQALRVAQEEAGGELISTGHVVLGVLGVSGGQRGWRRRVVSVVERVLEGVEAEGVRAVLGGGVSVGPVGSEPEFAPQALRALEEASAVAERLGAARVGLEHVLLGVLATPTSVGSRALAACGASADRLVEGLAEGLQGEERAALRRWGVSGLGGRLVGAGVIEALERARWEAGGQSQAGTEFVLLGLLGEERVRGWLGVEESAVRGELRALGVLGEERGGGDVGLTRRVVRALELAGGLARARDHTTIGTEHLLLGLIREREGVAAQVLMNLGLELDAIEGEVLGLLGDRPRGRET